LFGKSGTTTAYQLVKGFCIQFHCAKLEVYMPGGKLYLCKKPTRYFSYNSILLPFKNLKLCLV
jgi:hypothetical protein